MTGRYENSDSQWQLIEDIVSPAQSMGRPRKDDKQMLNGIFWALCSGAKWRDLPECYGPWSTVYARFRQWRDDAGKMHEKPLYDGPRSALPKGPHVVI